MTHMMTILWPETCLRYHANVQKHIYKADKQIVQEHLNPTASAAPNLREKEEEERVRARADRR